MKINTIHTNNTGKQIGLVLFFVGLLAKMLGKCCFCWGGWAVGEVELGFRGRKMGA